MKQTITWLAWITLAAVAAVAALNWPMMTTETSFNLFVTEVRWPLGVIVLAMAAAPLLLFSVSYLQQQISTLIETRRLLKELQRAHELADKAEASRIDGLRETIAAEFRALNARLDSLGAGAPAVDVVLPEQPTSLRRILPPSWRGDAKSG